MKIQSLPKQRINSRGQAVILVAVTFMALLAIVALAIDLGRIFIGIGALRRAVDAAALAGASQFREGRTLDEMAALADQVMNLNHVDPSEVEVTDCNTAPTDMELCVTPRRKKIRVTASMVVEMTFLRVLGINQYSVQATAVSEAASLDVVLVLDISESMTSDAGTLYDNKDNDEDGVIDDGRGCENGMTECVIPPNGDWDNAMADPTKCNPGDECYPFHKVRAAARNFAARILDLPLDQESDRLAIVTFANGWQAGEFQTRVQGSGWISSTAEAVVIIDDLKVYEPPECPSYPGICLNHDIEDNYQGVACPVWSEAPEPADPSSCTTTDIGGGLALAGSLLGEPATRRLEALWVVILLTDGAANASTPSEHNPFGYCPDTTWTQPFCRDILSSTRHYTTTDLTHYDADDFARDNAEFVSCYAPESEKADACAITGQSAVMYAIGLGDQVLKKYTDNGQPASDTPHGVALLRYAAAVGDDGDPATDPCDDLGLDDNEAEWKTWCGNYYFDATGDRLDRVFEDIASRIFTRLTH